MRFPFTRPSLIPALLAAAMYCPGAGAAPLAPAPLALQQLQVQTSAEAPDLECERKALVKTGRPAAKPAEPMEVPTDETVRDLTEEPDAAPDAPDAPVTSVKPLPRSGAYRIAIWGDSHLAANFFTEEMARQLKIPADNVSDVLVPANMGRAGVRLPLRRSCVSWQWKYEPAYLGGEAARTPGPGMVNMVADAAGATLAWDLRNEARTPNHERVRILYQQTEAPIVVAVSVDGGAETEVTLAGRPGPGALELAADKPISTVRMRLVDGPLRFHGLDLQARRAGPIVMDVFGYPGATVAAWKTAQLDYLAAWFAGRDYQVVMLEFGTNEGAGRPFDGAAYRKMLDESVRNMRTVFPNAACILIPPGDRGILVPQSANHRPRTKGKGKGKNKDKARAARAAPKLDLFVWSRVHADIGRLQRDVAGQAGCTVWSMMDAMGGPGQSYTWAHATPPLMARDLIHFTVAGYQRFAQQFVRDMGWNAPAANGQ